NGRNEWFNLLVSVGSYHRATFQISLLKTTLLYDPGTVLVFSGRFLRHGSSVAEGNHLCLMYYMREKMHEFVRVRGCNWMM
ncbi:hypothetical protein F5I97DRAFT_1785138, partial [Phlebopus sp. FC_14]